MEERKIIKKDEVKGLGLYDITDFKLFEGLIFENKDLLGPILFPFPFKTINPRYRAKNSFLILIPNEPSDRTGFLFQFIEKDGTCEVAKVIDFDRNENQLLTPLGKYLLLKSGDKKIIIGAEIEGHVHLRDIPFDLNGVYGGGWFDINHEKKTITLSGESIDYGPADHAKAASLLEENMPKYLEGYAVIAIPFKS